MRNECLPREKNTAFSDIDAVSEKIFDRIEPEEIQENNPFPSQNRVRTRLLNFAYYLREDREKRVDAPVTDSAQEVGSQPTSASRKIAEVYPTFGWLVIIDGAGRGASFPLCKDVSSLGRGSDQDVCLDFGDPYISRSEHATIHQEKDRGLIAVRCGGKRNPVLLNGKLLVGTRLLKHKALITVGQTTLRFVSVDAIDDPETFWST